MSRLERRFILVCLGLLAGVITLLVWQNLNHPLHDAFTNQSIPDGAVKVYQQPASSYWSPAPGNDSTIIAILRLSPGKAKLALATDPILSQCAKNQGSCTHNPTWRPRSLLVNTQGAQYQFLDIADKPEAKELYSSLIDDTATECAAYNISHAVKPVDFNSILVCVNDRLSLLSYEYLSRHDGFPY